MHGRRKFIKKSGIVSAICISGFTSTLQGCTTIKYAQYTASGNELQVSEDQFLKEDEFLVVDYPQLKAPVFLCKQSDEEYKSFLMLCTHKACDVKPAGSILVCPCHGSEFNRNGEVLNGPADKPLKEYPTIIEDSKIKISLV